LKKHRFVIIIFSFLLLTFVTVAGCGEEEVDVEEENGEKDKMDEEKMADDFMDIPEFDEVKDNLKEEVTMQKVGEIIMPKLEDWREEMDIIAGDELEDDDLVALVDGEEITKEEFDMYLQEVMMMMQMQGIEVTEEEQSRLENEVFEEMISQEILYQQALEKGIEVDDEAVEEQMDQVKTQFESEEKLTEALEESGLTKEGLREQIEQESITMAFIDSFKDEVEISDEELKDIYNEYIEQLEMQQEMMMPQQGEQDMKEELMDELEEEGLDDEGMGKNNSDE